MVLNKLLLGLGDVVCCEDVFHDKALYCQYMIGCSRGRRGHQEK